MDYKNYLLFAVWLAMMAVQVYEYKQNEQLNIGLKMQQEANKGLLQQISRNESQLHEKDLKIDALTKKIESSNNVWIPVEVTYYSSKEMTDVAKYAPMNCYGGYLQNGDYSAPDFLPVGTEFAIKYSDGHSETGIVKDRGASSIVRVYDRNSIPTLKGAKLRLDKLVNSVEGKGIDFAYMQILKWGK